MGRPKRRRSDLAGRPAMRSPVARRWGAGSIDSGSGRRSRVGWAARRPGLRRVCRRRSASGGFGRVAACRLSPRRRCRGATCHSRSARRSRWCAPWLWVRETARQLGRSPSTISRELRRNAATRGGGLDYRASTAQWHADLRARRPKAAKLAVNSQLRRYVQDGLYG